MVRGLNSKATRPLLGLAPQLVRGLVGQRMTPKPTSTEIVFIPPLDEIAASSAAYGLRRVRSAYTGPAIRVRRSSDNAEADIGFTSAGNLNIATLLAFCGISSGFVTTWHDQSGNGRHLVQTTAAAQPRIVNAGVVDLSGGLPAIICDSSNDQMATASWGTIAQPFSRNAVVQMPTSIANFSCIIRNNVAAPSDASEVMLSGQITMYAGSNGPTASVSTNERLVYSTIFNGASSVIAKNGTLSSTANPGSNANQGIAINSNDISSLFGGFIYQEIVVFDRELSTTDRQTLERNQGAYYGITVA